MHELLGRRDPSGPGWVDMAGFQMRYLEAHWMRYLYREVFAERDYWFSADTTRPVILDCGSNIGMAILFFKALYPDAEITAFEPAPWACSAMEETIHANALRDVTLYNAALAEQDGMSRRRDRSDPTDGDRIPSPPEPDGGQPRGMSGDPRRKRIRLSAHVDARIHADHARTVSGRAGARVSEVARVRACAIDSRLRA